MSHLSSFLFQALTITFHEWTSGVVVVVMSVTRLMVMMVMMIRVVRRDMIMVSVSI